MSKFNEFGQKINIFEKRTQNKKYLTKKKQYHEKHHQEYTKENEIMISKIALKFLNKAKFSGKNFLCYC